MTTTVIGNIVLLCRPTSVCQELEPAFLSFFFRPRTSSWEAPEGFLLIGNLIHSRVWILNWTGRRILACFLKSFVKSFFVYLCMVFVPLKKNPRLKSLTRPTFTSLSVTEEASMVTCLAPCHRSEFNYPVEPTYADQRSTPQGFPKIIVGELMVKKRNVLMWNQWAPSNQGPNW